MGLFDGGMSVGDVLQDVVTLGGAGRARKAASQIGDAYAGLELPDIEQMKLQLEQAVLQGQLTPEQAQVYLQEQSQMGGISLDPKLQKAQMDALSSLQQIGQGGGLTDMDRAQLAQIQSAEDMAARGQRERIQQSMQERGLGGSGMDMLAQMVNQQEGATRRAARDTDVAGMAQQRALQALQSAGQLGGNIQQQDFSRQAQMAQAQDAINQFNTQNRNQLGLANTQMRNEAAGQNLAERQRIADTNVQMRNQQQVANKQLPQQQFQNQLNVAQGRSGAAATQAEIAAREAEGNKGLLGSVLQAGATYGASKK